MMSKKVKKLDLKGVKIPIDKNVPKKKVKRPVKRKTAKKSTLPSKFLINGVTYNVPSRLRGLRIKGSRINDDVKAVVYTIYLELNKKFTLQRIVDTLYFVRDEYAFNSGKYKPVGILNITCFRYMSVDSDYAMRSDLKDKIISIHRTEKNIQNFRFECFQCERHVFLKFVPALVEVDRELNFFWEARELYLEQHGTDTLMFGIWFFFEPLTRFAYLNFNDIIVDGGDLQVFKMLLEGVKNDYNDSVL